MKPERLLIAGADAQQDVFLTAAASFSSQISLIPYTPDLDIKDFQYLLMWRPVPGLIEAMPHLKAIFYPGAGVDRLLARVLIPHNIPIIRMVEPGLTASMVEYMLWQTLRHHRRMWELEEAQAQEKWAPHWYPAAWDRPVGILGLGELGQAAGEKLIEFGFPVRGWTRSPRKHDSIQCFSGASELPAFLDNLQILICLLPLTMETKGILNAALFMQLKPGASLINAARGDHLVESDLLAVLESGQMAAASLDVFSDEPLPKDHPFWIHPRIFISPHNAGDIAVRAALAVIMRQIARDQLGDGFENIVDRARGY